MVGMRGQSRYRVGEVFRVSKERAGQKKKVFFKNLFKGKKRKGDGGKGKKKEREK